MAGYRRARRIKWLGVILCALLLTISVGSIFFEFECELVPPEYPDDPRDGWGQVMFQVTNLHAAIVRVGESRGYSSGVKKLSRGSRQRQRLRRYWLPTVDNGSRWYTAWILPLWIPLVVAVAVAAVAARAERLRHTGYCNHCGYNLTGNVSGRCPECGEPVGQATTSVVESPPDGSG